MNSSSEHNLMIGTIRVPRFLYGTAWKEDDTQRLTALSLQQGFRGIDTANQRRHYNEAGVGKAIVAAIQNGVVVRDDLFLQTKFTFRGGQDHRLPYDSSAPVPIQVEQSFTSSLEHLCVENIDSYMLHGPSQRFGLAEVDWEAWQAMETIQRSGRVRWLGVSNVDVSQLQLLCQEANVLPRFVQNRCFAVAGWDRRVREFCAANDIVYQGFSLLTANRDTVACPELRRIATRHGRDVKQIVFRFALDVGMIPLTGTCNANHMCDDLDIFNFRLDPDEVEQIERVAG